MTIIGVLIGFANICLGFILGTNDHFLLASIFIICGGGAVTVFGSQFLDGGRK